MSFLNPLTFISNILSPVEITAETTNLKIDKISSVDLNITQTIKLTNEPLDLPLDIEVDGTKVATVTPSKGKVTRKIFFTEAGIHNIEVIPASTDQFVQLLGPIIPVASTVVVVPFPELLEEIPITPPATIEEPEEIVTIIEEQTEELPVDEPPSTAGPQEPELPAELLEELPELPEIPIEPVEEPPDYTVGTGKLTRSVLTVRKSGTTIDLAGTAIFMDGNFIGATQAGVPNKYDFPSSLTFSAPAGMHYFTGTLNGWKIMSQLREIHQDDAIIAMFGEPISPDTITPDRLPPPSSFEPEEEIIIEIPAIEEVPVEEPPDIEPPEPKIPALPDEVPPLPATLPPGTYYFDPCQGTWAILPEGRTPESMGYCSGGIIEIKLPEEEIEEIREEVQEEIIEPEVEIEPLVAIEEPISAEIRVSKNSGDSPLTVGFELVTNATRPMNVTWDFGDGSPPNTFQNPGHTFKTDLPVQVFNVTVGIVDAKGRVVSDDIQITVAGKEPEQEPDLEPLPVQEEVPEEPLFDTGFQF